MQALQNAFDQVVIRFLLLVGAKQVALQHLQAVLNRNPNNIHALASRAQLYMQLGQRHLALADLQRTCQATPDTDWRASHAWYNLGYLLNETQRLDEAEPAFRKAIELNPKLDLAWYGLSLVLIQQRRLDEAVAALKKNTQLQPMSPYGWYQLARVHMDRKAPEEAEKVIRHLRGFEPKIADQLVRETGIAA